MKKRLNALFARLPHYQAMLDKRLEQCFVEREPYRVQVSRLTPQDILAIEKSVADNDRQFFLVRLLTSRRVISHQRRLLALYHEQALLKQLQTGRVTGLEAQLAAVSQWYRYTPTLGLWEQFTHRISCFLGINRSLRHYRSLVQHYSALLQVAVIPPTIPHRLQAEAEVERLFNDHPTFEPYRLLGLLDASGKPNYPATTAEIKTAYHHLMQQHHPDRKLYQPTATAASPSAADINLAYTVLGDPLRKGLWDRKFKNPDFIQRLIISLRQRAAVEEKIKIIETELKQMKQERQQDKIERQQFIANTQHQLDEFKKQILQSFQQNNSEGHNPHRFFVDPDSPHSTTTANENLDTAQSPQRIIN